MRALAVHVAGGMAMLQVTSGCRRVSIRDEQGCCRGVQWMALARLQLGEQTILASKALLQI